MSAYVVERNTILYMVAAMRSKRIARHGNFSYYKAGEEGKPGTWVELSRSDLPTAVKIANILWQENIKSVLYRYPGNTIDCMPGPGEDDYTIALHEIANGSKWNTIDPVQVLSTINCYTYQTCEHPEWEDSEAFKIIRSLESAAIHALPGYDDTYGEAPPPDWPITPRKLAEIAKKKAEQEEAEREAGAEPLNGRDTAIILRKDLKIAFPGVKFSVRCRSGKSTTTSVEVSWADGPTYNRVNDWLAKYRHGRVFDFNGKVYRSGFDYASTNRTLTPAFLQAEIDHLWDISGDIKAASAPKPEIVICSDGSAFYRCDPDFKEQVAYTFLDTFVMRYIERIGGWSEED